MATNSNSMIGMPGAVNSNTNVGYGVNQQNADRGNENGDVVDNTQAQNPVNDSGLRTDPADARGAYLDKQSKAPALYPNS